MSEQVKELTRSELWAAGGDTRNKDDRMSDMEDDARLDASGDE